MIASHSDIVILMVSEMSSNGYDVVWINCKKISVRDGVRGWFVPEDVVAKQHIV